MNQFTVRPGLRRMSTKYERLAKIEPGQVVCPYCGSANTAYAEDRTVSYQLRRPPGANGDLTLIVEGRGEMLEVADNERILCRDCIRDSGIPAMCELIFE
jgi:hypothetical protein